MRNANLFSPIDFAIRFSKGIEHWYTFVLVKKILKYYSIGLVKTFPMPPQFSWFENETFDEKRRDTVKYESIFYVLSGFNNFLPYCSSEKFSAYDFIGFNSGLKITVTEPSNHDTRGDIFFSGKKLDRDTHFPLLSKMTLQL